jgi:large-conductance mechanosensitive channel
MDKPGSLFQGYEIPLDENFKLGLGNLFGSFFEFFLVCLLVYIIYIKLINNLLIEKEQEDTKQCPYCFKQINKLSKKCAFCTSSIKSLNQKTKPVK